MYRTPGEEQIYFNELYKTCLTSGHLMYAGHLLARAAHMFTETTALIYKDTSLTYGELYKKALAFSKYSVNTYGLRVRDRVIVCFPNSPEFYIAYYGLWQAGVIVIPVNTFLKEKELAHIIHHSNPRLIITSSEHSTVFKNCPVLLPPIITEEQMHHTDSNFTLVSLKPDETALLVYTSGTTGIPKGVMLSSRNIMMNVLQIAARLDIPHSERLFGVLPLFHSFAQNTCVWTSLFFGVTVILVPKIERHAIVDAFAHKPTILIGVPALYGLLCLLRNISLASVRLIISGGDALPDKIRAAFGLIYRRRICNGYGLTETSPVISVFTEDESAPTSNVGRPLYEIECEARDENGTPLQSGSIGILWVKGANVMQGYYKAPEETAAIYKDGWLNTGDLGYIDHKGRIVITGRQKDLIINKGINIYPQEIENIILLHPAVIQVAVVGQQDDIDGEIPVAFVQVRELQDNITQTIRALCTQHLATYKIPRKFFIDTQELPTTATGKIDKKILRVIAREKI